MSELKDGMWAGERCWVVGGGPSLYGFDWSQLDGERVIAVNRAYEVLPGAIVCSMDPMFWKLHGLEIHSWPDMPRRVAVHVRVGDQKLPRCGPTHVVPCCADLSKPNPHLEAVWGTSLETGLGCGGNSGFAALNLADVLGAEEILLLGFDMRGAPDGMQLNWHDGYLEQRQKNCVYDRMRAAFGEIASEIRGTVRTVYTPSRLRSFPRVALDEVT